MAALEWGFIGLWVLFFASMLNMISVAYWKERNQASSED